MLYTWIKAVHVIAMVAWFAGMFYIFRLFVYHVKYRERAGMPEVYQEMERKLIRAIMTPSAVLTAAMGATLLVLNPALLRSHWLHVKLLGVLVLIGYHVLAEVTRRRFARGDYYLSERACRVINEVPVLPLVLIVIMVIVRPF